MGLENRLANAIGSLSGGQRQALTLLMATWLKPELLLLDEHTAALDPKSADQVIRISHEIIQRHKLTTLMVTHSMQQAVHLGDRIIMIHRGQVLHDLRGTERARVRPEDCWAASKRSGGENNSIPPRRKCCGSITFNCAQSRRLRDK
jgi:putative ABC transport system ATP-binding protein